MSGAAKPWRTRDKGLRFHIRARAHADPFAVGVPPLGGTRKQVQPVFLFGNGSARKAVEAWRCADGRQWVR
eukprot:2892980-Pyramimonas_sp.AAC.1